MKSSKHSKITRARNSVDGTGEEQMLFIPDQPRFARMGDGREELPDEI